MPSAVQGNPVAVEDNHLVDAPHGAELPRPGRVPVAVVLLDERVATPCAGLTGKRAFRESRDVHSGRDRRGSICVIGGAGSELPRPGRVPVAVVLPDEGIAAPRARLVGEGADRRSAHVQGGVVAGDAGGVVRGGGPELPRPCHVSVRVVLPDENINIPRPRLAGEGAIGPSCGIDSRGVCGDGVGGLRRGGPELPRPYHVSVRVILPDESVPTPCAGLTGKRAFRESRDVHRRFVYEEVGTVVYRGGPELPGPERIPVAVILPDEGVVVACVRLAGERAVRGSCGVHAGGVRSDSAGALGGAGPELPRPDHVPDGVVLPDENVRLARIHLTGE